MTPATKNRIKDCIGVALLAVAATTLALCLASCRSTLATSTTHTGEAHAETSVAVSRSVDTVLVRDSVFVYATDRRTEVTRWRTQWRTLTVHDTVRLHTTDTVWRERSETVATAAPPARSARGKNGTVGWLAALLLAMALFGYAAWNTNRLNRR